MIIAMSTIGRLKIACNVGLSELVGVSVCVPEEEDAVEARAEVVGRDLHVVVARSGIGECEGAVLGRRGLGNGRTAPVQQRELQPGNAVFVGEHLSTNQWGASGEVAPYQPRDRSRRRRWCDPPERLRSPGVSSERWRSARAEQCFPAHRRLALQGARTAPACTPVAARPDTV